jgi:hypothetical protein
MSAESGDHATASRILFKLFPVVKIGTEVDPNILEKTLAVA